MNTFLSGRNRSTRVNLRRENYQHLFSKLMPPTMIALRSSEISANIPFPGAIRRFLLTNRGSSPTLNLFGPGNLLYLAFEVVESSLSSINKYSNRVVQRVSLNQGEQIGNQRFRGYQFLVFAWFVLVSCTCSIFSVSVQNPVFTF